MTLQELLGEELYQQVQTKLDAVNANEPDKLKHVRYADLSEGNYVGKGKYDALQEILNGKEAELTTANGLIAELKKATKGDEALQKKIGDYDVQVAQLQAELQETKIKSAVKVGLLSEHCNDVDYVTFKLMEGLKEKGETLELDDNENIKGWTDKLSGLKTQLPAQFGTKGTGKMQVLGGGKLPEGEKDNTLTKESLLNMPYNERNRIFRENPEAYKAAMNS